MNRAELLARLEQLKPYFEQRGLAGVRLFGSFARDEAGPGSDIDLVVELTRPLGLELFEIERELGERLGRRVDILVEPIRNPFVRKAADRDSVAL